MAKPHPPHNHDDHNDHHHHESVVHHQAHDHGHAHHHHSLPANHNRAFIIAIILNMAFVVVEFSYGFIANSTALMADAGHNLSDVLGLLLALGAVMLGRKKPSERYTYGLRSSSILAALANAILLLVACGAIAWEAVHRFLQPPVVASMTVTVVAAIGIVVNGISAWLFAKGSENDLNIRGAYLHMLADAMVSLAVVVSGLIMMFSQWYWLDPVVSLVIVAVIIFSTWGLLRDSTQLILNAVPTHINVTAIKAYLRSAPGVTAMHDLHIWGMSTSETALTVHLEMPNGCPDDAFLNDITANLKSRFAIHHATLQIVRGSNAHSCALHDDHPAETAPKSPNHA
jgi:cobalt-zinc-cadmium efflux system protein